MRFFLLIFALALGALPVRAQMDRPASRYASYGLGDGGAPFSADFVGAAHAGSFTPTAEPLAFHLNPALLAGVGRNRSVLATGDISTEYASDAIPGTTHVGVAGGTVLSVGGRPLALGVGFSRTELDYGPVALTSPTDPDVGTTDFEAYETDWSAALGAGWSGPLEVDLGVGLHRRAEVVDGSRREGLTVDLGTIVTVPLLGRTARGSASPMFEVSTGYVQRHIGFGNEVRSFDGETVDAKTLREGVLGSGARAGLDVALGPGYVRAFEVDGRFERVATLADEALYGRSAVNRRALRVTLFDALSYTRGRATGLGEDRTTWGAAADLGGMLRLIGLVAENPALAETGDRLTLRASYGAYTNNGFEFAFSGLTLGWRP